MKKEYPHEHTPSENPGHISRRQFIKNTAAAAVVAAASPALLTRYAHAGVEPINIGAVVSLTGYLSAQAQNVVEGLELGAYELNKKGGLLGRPVKVYARDDEMKPPVGARRFVELIKNQGIVMESGVVFGPIGSILEQTNKQRGAKGIIEWTAAASRNVQIPKDMDPKLFLCGSALEAYGLVGGEHMAKHVGKKTFVFYADYSWGWDIKDAFIKNATANGAEILGTLAIPPATMDFEPFLTQLMTKKIDYATLVINGMMFVNCMKQAYAMGLKDKMKFVTFHVNIEEVNACGPEVIKDVLLVTDYFWNIQTPKNKHFLDLYFEKYGTAHRPSMRVFLHYTSVMMWADVVKRLRTVDPNRVAAGLPGFKGDFGEGMEDIRRTGDHTTIKPVVVARGKGPKEMKNKFDTQEIVKLYKGDKYFYSPKEKGW